MESPSPQPPPDSFNPGEVWLFLSLSLVAVGVCQWGSVLHSKAVGRLPLRKTVDEESTHMSARSRSGTGWSLARLPLAAVNVFRVVAFRWTLEFGTYDLRVVDIFLTLAYIALLLTWTFVVGGQVIDGLVFDVIRWSGHAGLVAASQFPLVTALGTKNNIVSLITGIGYEKLNYFHRVAARSCFGLLLIHIGGKIYSSEGISIMNIILQLSWLRFAIVAITSLTILFIVSLRWIRTKAYELFFYTHFFAVFIFLLGAYFHTKQSNASYWIWPCFMFWALDRFMRVARILFCNYSYCGFGPRAKLQDATTELLSDDFVRFPLESHPFSISSLDSPLFQPGVGDPSSARNGETGTTTDAAHWKELVFLVNVRGGFTRRLRDAAAQSQTVKLFIDGPYGCAPNMKAYNTSVFVAGGSGITYTLPVFLNLIEAARKGLGQCRRVVFIWAVRDASHIQWISDALLRANSHIPTWLAVSIKIFVTGGESQAFGEGSTTDPERTPEKESSHDWIVPSFVRLENGRPDLKSILHGEVNMATGSMSVTVCGSQSLTRSVRRALTFPVSGPCSILNGGPSVTLHIESFGYA